MPVRSDPVIPHGLDRDGRRFEVGDPVATGLPTVRHRDPRTLPPKRGRVVAILPHWVDPYGRAVDWAASVRVKWSSGRETFVPPGQIVKT